MNSIASGNYPFLNSIIGNNNGDTAKHIAFYKTNSGLGLLIATAYGGSYISVADEISNLIHPDYKFPSSKSNCTILNKWHVISVTWSNGKNPSNCWSNGEKLMTFHTGNAKGTNHCIIGDLGKTWGKLHLICCTGEIIGFHRSLTDKGSVIFYREGGLWKFFEFCKFLVIPPYCMSKTFLIPLMYCRIQVIPPKKTTTS